ncbi:hypothetical protein LG489_002898 [Listeria monocytogenes]|uniref:hypothetical protein n=1 Tax=Listeria monocytogenes TaxID=1639 RepID=UPI0010EB6DA4|nr:hypothetical protein [Listeria monocytogenes]EAD3310064.1 hypothetical protein [Listeria monocytogenes]EAE7321133.1 hypothetical protein [Listeria monocytogenes]EAF1403409.1 hypothetical protein [Listeria monocytogenes]EAF2521846.1 hypothetical protein [Listeria monocytogenes]EHZ7831755.1 hypothetical protein [Listeria monocytogenes]
MSNLEVKAFKEGILYRNKQLVKSCNYQLVCYKLTTIIKNGDKEAFLEMLQKYSKSQKEQIPSVFENEELNDVQQFKTVAYAFMMGLSRLRKKSDKNAQSN